MDERPTEHDGRSTVSDRRRCGGAAGESAAAHAAPQDMRPTPLTRRVRRWTACWTSKATT